MGEQADGTANGRTAGRAAGEVQRALDALAERAWGAGTEMIGGAEGLTLAEAVAALEAAGSVLEAVWQMLDPLTARIEQIRDREMTERGGGTKVELMDGAGGSLAYGRDAVMVAFHLLEVGGAGLARVAQGEA